MPLVTFFTTVPQAKITADVLKRTTQFLAKLLSKPEERGLMKAGTMEPSGYGHISSIDRFTVEANKKYAPEICRHFESVLGIPAKRISIVLHDVPGTHIISEGKPKA